MILISYHEKQKSFNMQKKHLINLIEEYSRPLSRKESLLKSMMDTWTVEEAIIYLMCITLGDNQSEVLKKIGRVLEESNGFCSQKFYREYENRISIWPKSKNKTWLTPTRREIITILEHTFKSVGYNFSITSHSPFAFLDKLLETGLLTQNRKEFNTFLIDRLKEKFIKQKAIQNEEYFDCYPFLCENTSCSTDQPRKLLPVQQRREAVLRQLLTEHTSEQLGNKTRSKVWGLLSKKNPDLFKLTHSHSVLDRFFGSQKIVTFR